MSAPTVLVMGANGSVGGAVVRELLHGDTRVNVRASVRRPEVVDPLRRLGAEVVMLDLDGIERAPLGANHALRAAVDGVDRLLLLTGYSVDMLVHSKAVIDAAVAAGVKHVVHVGAFSRDDTTIAHLGWHQFVERYIETSGMGFTHLRPHAFMQNILRFGTSDGGVINQFMGDARVSWVDSDDVARVAAAILRAPAKHRGKMYPLAVEAASVHDVAAILADVVGRPFRYQPSDPDVWLPAAIAGGFEPTYARCIHNTFRRTIDGSIAEVTDVFDNIEAITGVAATRWRDHAARYRDEYRRLP